MSRVISAFLLSLLIFATLPLAFAQDDCENCKDHPAIPRMPGYKLGQAQERQFDSFTFTTAESGKAQELAVEGHFFYFRYDIREGKTVASALQVIRNYQNAARNAGGKTLWETGEDGDRSTTVRFSKGAQEIWVQVHAVAEGATYDMNVVEKQAMTQDITLDSKALAATLAEAGHVAVPGILFDFNKSEVKPESDPALQQMAALLRENPTMKLWVVGHTDSVGTPEANLKLSNDRAGAIVAVLTQKHGVAAGRLSPFGAGPYSPVASNATEEGCARNRRVELVVRP